MFNIKKFRELKQPKVIAIGNHEGIIQSILDFDFLTGKETHDVLAIVGVQQKYLKYFWGEDEILIPGYKNLDELPENIKINTNLFVIAQSARRVLSGCKQAIEYLPNVVGGMIFAEGVPEQHSIKLKEVSKKNGVCLIGPASVGLVISGKFKLGAIGGTTISGIEQAGIKEAGSLAVISSSGGMVNEIINIVSNSGGRISFAVAVGGERYPVTSPLEVFKEAMKDPETKAILYFGELGALDEYEIADYVKKNGLKKPVVCYIAGKIAEYFETPPQFGHAKSMAGSGKETASAKKEVLKSVGVAVADSFLDFENKVGELSKKYGKTTTKMTRKSSEVKQRRKSVFINRISSDKGDDVKILGQNLLDFTSDSSYSSVILSMLLGNRPKSKELPEFFESTLKLLVDHGPQVSGAVNTMISARAGKDLASSLASGILTIGPRFGGAINNSATNWLHAIESGVDSRDFVETFAKAGEYIPGIGHKKYSSDNPDPRVKFLLDKFDVSGEYLEFAKKVEKITLSKKPNLILNVDGLIGALMIDLLIEKEKMTVEEVKELVRCEFFNAIFILARSVGFTAHYMEQKRLDEGLFRLPDDHISSL